MNVPLRRLLQSLIVCVPLLPGPLGSQEPAPDAQKPVDSEPAASKPAAEEPAKDAPDTSTGKPAATAPPADADDDAGTEENVSADNSLSFPVDI
jgi:hypothetical protein